MALYNILSDTSLGCALARETVDIFCIATIAIFAPTLYI
jgi:hypothetical protein